jgi:hypothetical protein
LVISRIGFVGGTMTDVTSPRPRQFYHHHPSTESCCGTGILTRRVTVNADFPVN